MHKVITIFLALFCFLSPIATADDYFFVLQKQEQKKARRWNLEDWIEQRDKNRMMDLWLALHSPTPYEFYVSGQYQTGNYKSGAYANGYDVSIAAYAYLFGVSLKRESFSGGAATEAMFHLRLFGFQAQGTNIMLMAGAEQTDRAGVQLWHPKAGATLTWYLYKALGLEAGYHYNFNASSAAQSLNGSRWNAGALLDFSFVRLYGGYFETSERGTLALPRRGIYLGTKLFF